MCVSRSPAAAARSAWIRRWRTVRTTCCWSRPTGSFRRKRSKAGLRLSFARDLRRNDRRTIDPAWKTGNYLNNLLCLREARARGADEVVMVNLMDEITEAAVSNVHFVRGGAVLTPALASGLLAGVTRRVLLERIAPAARD